MIHFFKNKISPLLKFQGDLKNVPWMVTEQFFRMVSGLLVSIFIARYLNPENYGKLNYIIAFVSVFVPFVQLGMFSILVREVINLPNKKYNILGTAFSLSLIFAIITSIVLNIVNYYYNDNIKYLISIYSLILIFKSFDNIDYYFQSQNKAKWSSIPKILVYVILVILKLILVYYEYSFEYFVYANIIEVILIATLLFINFKLNTTSSFFYFDKIISIRLLKSAWPMVISSLSIILFMRIDQLMIVKYLSMEDMGIYSAVTKLYEGYAAIVYTVSVSLLPLILKSKKDENDYLKKLSQIISILFYGCLIITIVVFILDDVILKFIYGEKYLKGNHVLVIMFLTSCFSALNSISNRYFTSENMEKKIMKRTIISLLINVFLNLILIPKFGIEGAAFTTLFSMIIGSYILDYFDNDLKDLINVKNNAFLLKNIYK